MKKIFLTLLTGLFISLSVFAQNYTLIVSGAVMVVADSTIAPVPNQAVNIMIDSTNNGFVYQSIVYTDQTGYYEETITLPDSFGYGYVFVSTYDSCLGQYLSQGQFIAPGTTVTRMDFYLCDNTPDLCQALFYYYQTDPADPFTFTFVNQSIGNYTQVTWNFGDSIFSTEISPTYTFPGPGDYYVCLTISDGADCYSTYCETVYTGGGENGCENYFTYTYDEPFTLTFEGFLYNGQGAQNYLWDFGDGTTGTGQTITHYFQENPAGGYTVCLTTTTVSPDSGICTASYCEVINLDMPGFNIFGSVYLYGDLVADQAVVHLMTMDTAWQNVIEVQSTTIDSGGFYSFPEISMYDTRLYFVQAELTEGSAYFGQYLPTYHISALTWEEAEPILPLMSSPADIFMITGNPVEGGNCAISGVVSNLGTRGFMNDVEVVLMDADNNPLSYLRSDEQGSFLFNNLPYGTYIIHAEIIGIHTIQAQVTLSTDQPEANVEVRVSNNEANIVFGVPEQNAVLEKVGEIYPNPVNENLRLDITVKKPVSLEISIFGRSGQLLDVMELSSMAGTQSIKLDTGKLPAGLYLFRIKTGQGDVVNRRFIKIL